MVVSCELINTNKDECEKFIESKIELINNICDNVRIELWQYVDLTKSESHTLPKVPINFKNLDACFKNLKQQLILFLKIVNRNGNESHIFDLENVICILYEWLRKTSKLDLINTKSLLFELESSYANDVHQHDDVENIIVNLQSTNYPICDWLRQRQYYWQYAKEKIVGCPPREDEYWNSYAWKKEDWKDAENWSRRYVESILTQKI